MSSNAHGQRIVKATPTTTTYFVHRGGGQLLSEYQATEGDPVLVREYIYLGGRLLASLAGPANGRPEVEITSPDANDGFTAPGNITVTATACGLFTTKDQAGRVSPFSIGSSLP